MEIKPQRSQRTLVALLAEGVDRNLHVVLFGLLFQESPSSRRAWIEIAMSQHMSAETLVALLAEGVDRNSAGKLVKLTTGQSPSSRRAWIEMTM